MIKNKKKWGSLLFLFMSINMALVAQPPPPPSPIFLNPDGPPEDDNNLPIDSKLWILTGSGFLYVLYRFKKK